MIYPQEVVFLPPFHIGWSLPDITTIPFLKCPVGQCPFLYSTGLPVPGLKFLLTGRPQPHLHFNTSVKTDNDRSETILP